jgi:hypothetical protein
MKVFKVHLFSSKTGAGLRSSLGKERKYMLRRSTITLAWKRNYVRVFG